jgi:hypothetical protein
MRSTCGLIAVALAAAGLRAQTASIPAQEAESARRLLGSMVWADKAWGAYFAGRLHSDELAPALIEQFRFATALPGSQTSTEPGAYLAVLFDAAIEAGIKTPADILEPFAETWTDPVLILLARNRDSDSEKLLLRLGGEKARNAAWLTANNLLAERRSQLWYDALLGEVTITHRFVVTDPDGGAGWGSGGLGGGGGDSVAAAPKGFPPVTFYRLEAYARAGNVLLVKGPQDAYQRYDVYYQRIVVPTGKQTGMGVAEPQLDRTAARIAYLGKLGGRPGQDVERLFRATTDISFSTPDAFALRAQAAMDAQAQSVRALIQRIAKEGLSPSRITLRITPEVDDRRQNSTEPLPAIAAEEIDLR